MRIRVIYSKTGTLRYTSNLDMQRIWERLLRRAGLQIAYTQGFHPTPKLQQGCPLPLGYISRCEVVDFSLDGEIDTEKLADLLQRTAVPGIGIISTQTLPDHEPALVTQLDAAEYLVQVKNTKTQTNGLLNLIDAKTLPLERRGKMYDLRPLILKIREEPDKNGICVFTILLRSSTDATGRPDEVLLAAGIDPNTADIERTALILSNGTRI